MGRECANCLFARVSIVRGYKALTCHRYAPRPLEGGAGTGWSDYQWPVIAADEFCGEWALTDGSGGVESKEERDDG